MRKSIAAGLALASFIPFLASAATLPDFTTMLACFQAANSDRAKIQQCTNSLTEQFTSQVMFNVPSTGWNFTIPVRDSASVTLTTSQLISCLQSNPSQVNGCIDTFRNSLFSSLPSVASSSAVSIPTSQFIACIRNAGSNLYAMQACKAPFLDSLPPAIQLPPTPNVNTLFGTSSLTRCIEDSSGDLSKLNACTRGFRTPLDSILDTVDPGTSNLPPNVRTLVTCIKNAQPGDTAAIGACRDSFTATTNASSPASTSSQAIPDTASMPQNIRVLVTCLRNAGKDTPALASCYEAFRATLPAQSNSAVNPTAATSSLSADSQTRIAALQAQVQQLVQRLEQLRASQGAGAPQTGASPRLGHLLKHLSFGSREALKNWQSSHGLVTEGDPATTGWGRVGPKTLAEINRFIDRLVR